jgi:hypothetical protein
MASLTAARGFNDQTYELYKAAEAATTGYSADEK